jgi:hypothetical protein
LLSYLGYRHRENTTPSEIIMIKRFGTKTPVFRTNPQTTSARKRRLGNTSPFIQASWSLAYKAECLGQLIFENHLSFSCYFCISFHTGHGIARYFCISFHTMESPESPDTFFSAFIRLFPQHQSIQYLST